MRATFLRPLWTATRRALPALVGAALAAAPAAVMAQQVPTGFQIQPVVGVPLAPLVSAFAFLPDGRILVLEKDTGGVRLAAAGASTSVVIATIPDITVTGERGLLGVAVDPDWPSRPYLYFLFTHTSGTTRLVLYTASGDLSAPASTNLGLGSPYVLLDDIPDLYDNHNGGTLRCGPDGFLYVSLGDDSRSCEAQDTAVFNGKILRLDVAAMPGTGGGPPPKAALVAIGNPFAGSANARLVFAYGFRNPFRFSIDPRTNDVFIGDVGLETWEEVDHLVYDAYAGENYGWPEFEGPLQDPDPNASDCSMGPFVSPIYHYPNPPGGNVASVICGPLYRGSPTAAFAFPRAYDGDLFVCEFYARWIRRLARGPSGWALAAPVAGQPNTTDWATDLGHISDIQVGPDGALYILVMFNGGLLPRGVHRIVNTLPSDAGDDAAAGARVPGAFAIVAHPNPARVTSRVRLQLVVPESTRGAAAMPRRARILDAGGRVVRLLPFDGTVSNWSAAWDGRDAGGAPAAPGLYLVEVETRAGPARGKLTLIR